MNNRMQQFIVAENISQSQFADTIGVARASVSHILAGRNKPGFDFIESMSRHFPTLNLEWLITGKGKMYKGDVSSQAATPLSTAREDDLFSVLETEEHQPEVAKPIYASREKTVEQKPQPTTAPVQELPIPNTGKNISRIIIFFDDNTFQELK